MHFSIFLYTFLFLVTFQIQSAFADRFQLPDICGSNHSEDPGETADYGKIKISKTVSRRWRQQTTFFATNRTFNSSALQRRSYKEVFQEKLGSGLILGAASVSEPYDRSLGELKLPSSWWINFPIFSQPEREVRSPEHHHIVLNIKLISKTNFTNHLQEQADLCEQSPISMFVHGWNNSFEESLVRSHQFHWDIGHHGPVVVFSWPSKTNYHDAIVIAGDMDNSYDDFTQIIARTDLNKILLFAHSHGARIVLSSASRQLREPDIYNPFMRRLALYALMHADVHMDGMNQQYAPALERIWNSTIAFSATKDAVLLLKSPISKKLLGLNRERLAGGCVVLMNDTNHSAFADHPSALSFWRRLLNRINREESLISDCKEGVIKLHSDR